MRVAAGSHGAGAVSMRRRPAVSARAFVETKAGLERVGRRASLLIPATSEDAQGVRRGGDGAQR